MTNDRKVALILAYGGSAVAAASWAAWKFADISSPSWVGLFALSCIACGTVQIFRTRKHHMSEELFISNTAIARHIDSIGIGGEGRSTVVIAGNAAVAALKAALVNAGVADELRAPIIGHFVDEWNASVESGALRI